MLRHVVVLAGTVPVAAGAQQSAASSSLVFDRVTVIDVERGSRVPMQRVVITGNRIQAVGSSSQVSVPKGARVVDARDKFLIPGLWDLHLHPGPLTEIFYPLLLANGVTGIRDAGTPVPIDTLRRLQREILAGTRVGPPRQILSGHSLSYRDPCNRDKKWFATGTETCVADSADAVRYVDSLKAAGVDMIKIRDVPPAMYFVIAAEARRVGLPFGGHIADSIDLAASDSGATLFDHAKPLSRITTGLRGRCWDTAPGVGPVPSSASVERCLPVVEQFKRNNTWLVPTLLVDHYVTATKQVRLVLARYGVRAKEFWEGALPRGNWLHDSTRSDSALNAIADKLFARSTDLLSDSLGVMRVMQRAGVPIVAGSDISMGPNKFWGRETYFELPPGFALHTELAIDVAEGLTPLTALQSATLNPAKMWHATDSLGTVAPGKLADLVLLDADPLADITNTTTIRAVVANGRYFDRAALDAVLTDARAKGLAYPQPKWSTP